MTDTPNPTPPEDAIWPTPEGNLLDPLATTDGIAKAREALRSLEGWTMDLIESAPVKADPIHPTYVHDLAYLVDNLEAIIDKAKAIQAEAGEALAKAVPFGTPRIAFPGLRPLTPRWGGTRKEWAMDILGDLVKARVLVAPAKVDTETGEIVSPAYERTPEEVLDSAFSVVSLTGSNLKVTGLRALGLDPDDYCKKTPAPPTVQVTKDALDR